MILHTPNSKASFAFKNLAQDMLIPKKWATLFEYSEARLQDAKNRQNSIEIDDKKLQEEWEEMQQDVMYAAGKEYEWAIEKVLQKNKHVTSWITKTRLYMNGSPRSWVHYIELRSANGTQKEHMDIAKECALVIAKIFPMATDL